MEFRVWGLRFRIEGSGVRVEVSVFRVWGECLGFRVLVVGFGVEG